LPCTSDSFSTLGHIDKTVAELASLFYNFGSPLDDKSQKVWSSCRLRLRSSLKMLLLLNCGHPPQALFPLLRLP
jgi:hypothetical protein